VICLVTVHWSDVTLCAWTQTVLVTTTLYANGTVTRQLLYVHQWCSCLEQHFIIIGQDIGQDSWTSSSSFIYNQPVYILHWCYHMDNIVIYVHLRLRSSSSTTTTSTSTPIYHYVDYSFAVGLDALHYEKCLFCCSFRQHCASSNARSHARTVVRECCKGDDESQWERGKFDPPPPKNPLTDGHQNLCT